MRLAIVNAKVQFHEDADTIVIGEDGFIIDIGREYILRRHSPLKKLDVDQRIIVPGLVDSHLHLLNYAMYSEIIDLENVRSIEEIKEIISREIKRIGYGKWIVGRGWDQDKLEEKRYITRWDLDEVAPRNPVLLIRICGHLAVANTLALKIANINEKTLDPPNGVIGKEDGRLNGLLYETAIDLVRKVIPPPDIGKASRMLRNAMEEALSYGITEVHSMSVEELELLAIRLLDRSKELPLKYFAYINWDYVIKGGWRKFRKHILGAKIFVDGSFGARTAALREPYSDDPGNTGQLLLNAEEIASRMKWCLNRKLQIAIHAIGDRALEETIKTIEPISNKYVRIEHASLAPLDLINKLAELKVPVSVQPYFILSDTWIVDRLSDRTRWVYPYKTFLQRGIPLIGSSDAPVDPLNPWLSIYAAIYRGAEENLPIYKYTRGEKLSINEALQLYMNGRAVRGAETLIAKGSLADLAILNIRDLSIVGKKPEKIKAHIVLVNGKIRYKLGKLAWR